MNYGFKNFKNETSMEACFDAIEKKCMDFMITQPELEKAILLLTETMEEVYHEWRTITSY